MELDVPQLSSSFVNNPQQQALRLVEQIVRAQGAIFIRELLRTKKAEGRDLRIGTTKDEVLANLRDGIRPSELELEDILEWLGETEGWGRQHVYLFTVDPAAAQPRHFESEVAFRQHLRGTELDIDDTHATLFPDELVLGAVEYNGNQVELVWRKGRHDWVRTKDHDYEQRSSGDLYEFRAWRYEPRRAVQRFTFDLARHRAALFVQLPLGQEHNEAVDKAHAAAIALLGVETIRSVSLTEAIHALDRADLNEGGGELEGGRGHIQSQDTRFRAAGASVEFSADPDLPSYHSVEAVGRVRRAVRSNDFMSAFARFNVNLRTGPGMDRRVAMSVHGDDDRIYLHSGMAKDEVQVLIDKLYTVLE